VGPSSGGDDQKAQQAAAALAQMARASGPSLAEVLKPEVIIPLLQVSSILIGISRDAQFVLLLLKVLLCGCTVCLAQLA